MSRIAYVCRIKEKVACAGIVSSKLIIGICYKVLSLLAYPAAVGDPASAADPVINIQ